MHRPSTPGAEPCWSRSSASSTPSKSTSLPSTPSTSSAGGHALADPVRLAPSLLRYVIDDGEPVSLVGEEFDWFAFSLWPVTPLARTVEKTRAAVAKEVDSTIPFTPNPTSCTVPISTH